MLGELITRVLMLILGYVYPAFECFRSMEKNRVEIGELRFWCQYWIIIAILTVLERIGDVFVSWIPMYGEAKLGLFIYLWYSKAKGTTYIYENILRPYVLSHESDIDRRLMELRVRGWDLAVYYWQNCTELGQTAFFQMLQFLANQSARFSNSGRKENGKTHYPSAPPPPPLDPLRPPEEHRDHGKKKPSLPKRLNHSADQSDYVQLPYQTDFLPPDARSGSTAGSETGSRRRFIFGRSQ
ncbi:TB2/DP1/HVA22-related protein [Dillenia turbinata]|uniref:HVA22-like protein n=1 Tax=Dillenia turbinata TaxID=194707 RepID=A0AAN8W6F2_9MAGN